MTISVGSGEKYAAKSSRKAPVLEKRDHKRIRSGKDEESDSDGITSDSDESNSYSSTGESDEDAPQALIPKLSGPAPGGPQNPNLLISFEGHISHAIWSGQERDPLKVHMRNKILSSWKLPSTSDTKPTNAYANIARLSGLTHLQELMYRHINFSLISAFVERWHPETNTFHMPWGEMTITLHDVYMILGIPVDGDAIVDGENWDRPQILRYVAQRFVMSLEQVKEEASRGDSNIRVSSKHVREGL